MKNVKAYGASGALIGGEQLKPMDIERQDPKTDEILLEVLYCGVCHSDIHQVANDWKNTIYPCVPGHEIIGRVVSTGSAVTKFKAGDVIGVGCMIDSCQSCAPCKEGEEQFCQGEVGATMTYNGYFNPKDKNFNTYGGYSTHLVVHEKFGLEIPDGLDISKAAPILCAGVTTYSPLKHAGIKQGHTVGVVGIGGLGHMGVQIAKAMGAKVVAITTSKDKEADLLTLGADEVLISDDAEAMKAKSTSMDFILVTIPNPFDVMPYVDLLKWRGQLVTVGLLGEYKKPLNNMEVAKLGRSVGGSLIGGIAETQEVLHFCAKHNILPDVEMINIDAVNEAFDKIKNEDVRFRYVIDMASFKTA